MLLTWLDNHSGTVTAIATVVLAVFTVGYVILTQKMVKATRALAKETQKDRDIAHQPLLTWRIDVNQGMAEVLNNSPADAYFCYLIMENKTANGGASSWFQSDLFTLPPGGKRDDISVRRPVSIQSPPSDLAPQAAFCQNQFGHRFRYKHLTTDTDQWKPAQKNDRSPEPSWVTWYNQTLEARRRQLS
jgi:hypothetical protein